MEKKQMTFWVLCTVLLSMCLSGNPQAMAEQKEELTIAVAAWGNETLLPKTELAKQWTI